MGFMQSPMIAELNYTYAQHLVLIADEWVNGVFASTLLKWFEELSSTDPKPVCKWPTATTVC